MFMCSGQLFSHGASGSSLQTPARQRLARMWSSNSWRKWRRAVSTGVRRGLAKAAQRRVADHAAKFVELLQILLAALALRDARERAQRLVETDAAGRAPAAGFGAGEFDEVAGDVDHAVVFVHHHHAARAHDRAELAQRFVIDGRVQHAVRDAATGRTTGLHRFDVVAVHAAAADIVDELAERRAERHFHQAGIGDFADQREDLGAGCLCRCRCSVNHAGPLADDGRDVEPGFDVVDVGRVAPESVLRRDRADADANGRSALPAN